MVGSPTGTTLAPLQLEAIEGLAGSPIETLLVAIVAVAVVVFVGRFVLGVAWKLVRIGIVVVGVLWLLNVAVPTLL